MEFGYEYPHLQPAVSSQIIWDPDLIFLREDLMDEMGAIVGYLECADEVHDYEISKKFRQLAFEEEEHFSQLLKTISILDPVQGEEFRKKDLLFVPIKEQLCSYANICKNCGESEPEPQNSRKNFRERKHFTYDERTIECLHHAIRDETNAINAYQKQIQATDNPSIQSLLVTIMNKEKEHLAMFISIIAGHIKSI